MEELVLVVFSVCRHWQNTERSDSVCLLPAVCTVNAQPAPGADPHAEYGGGAGEGEAQSESSELGGGRQLQPLHQPGG